MTLAEYGTTCWLCGLPGSNSADHIIPRSKGGAVYDLVNLGPSHRSCNSARGNRDATDANHIVEDGLAFFSR
jgi:5-methylcytosine-specific restriction endonuclease McrA